MHRGSVSRIILEMPGWLHASHGTTSYHPQHQERLPIRARIASAK